MLAIRLLASDMSSGDQLNFRASTPFNSSRIASDTVRLILPSRFGQHFRRLAVLRTCGFLNQVQQFVGE
jgi:hypothetical protein